MKEVVFNKLETIFIVIASTLTFMAGKASLTKQESVKNITPFCMDFGRDEEQGDPDNNLSGNSGISKEYYTKQLHQFLNHRDSK